MMTRLFLILPLVLFTAVPAFAQAEEEPQTYYLEPAVRDEDSPGIYASVNYESIATQAIDKRPANFSFRYLRALYMQSAQYEPIAEDVNRQLLNHAYTIQNSQDWIEIDRAMEAFHTLVRDHLASIGVVEQALELSRQDSRFGDPALYEWVREGLIREIIKGGDGRNPSDAYDIITLEEEDYLVAQLGYEVLGRETGHAGVKYYNILEVGDPATGEEFTLFVDATWPSVKLQKEKERPAFAVDLLRQ